MLTVITEVSRKSLAELAQYIDVFRFEHSFHFVPQPSCCSSIAIVDSTHSTNISLEARLAVVTGSMSDVCLCRKHDNGHCKIRICQKIEALVVASKLSLAL